MSILEALGYGNGYCPPGLEHMIKCDFCNCDAGGGLSGHGGCFYNGEWWNEHCPKQCNEIEEASNGGGKRSNLDLSFPPN